MNQSEVPAGANAREAVNPPAVLLMISGGLGILVSVGLIGARAFLLQGIGSDPRFIQVVEHGNGPARFIGPLVWFAVSGFIIFGAMRMRSLQSHSLAMAAAVVAMIPCGGCCCIGLPVGIWALVTLMKPEIKSQFQG